MESCVKFESLHLPSSVDWMYVFLLLSSVFTVYIFCFKFKYQVGLRVAELVILDGNVIL